MTESDLSYEAEPGFDTTSRSSSSWFRNLEEREWHTVVNWWADRFEGGEEFLPDYYEHKDFDKFHEKLTKRKLNKDRQLDVVYDPILSLSRIRKELDSKLSQTNVGVIIVDYINLVRHHNTPTKFGQYDWMII